MIDTPAESNLDPLVSPLETPSSNPGLPLLLVAAALVLVAGMVSGFLLAGTGSSAAKVATTATGKDAVKTDNEVGIKDDATFGDEATGVIEAGGLNGEGTHKLIREGGPTKTAYLISSIVDLDQFVGKKVQVFGQTLKAQKVGWLMDVGRVKLLE